MLWKIFSKLHLSLVSVFFLAAVFLVGCSANARSTAVRMEKEPAKAEDYKADEFIGTPIMGDYDNNDDLDFVIGVADGERVFKIAVHEDAGPGNQEVLEIIRKRINEMEDHGSLRVIGYYTPEYRGQEKEYGFMDLKCIVFFNDETSYEEAFFTDAMDSRFYEEGDVTVIYAPGHHYHQVYYPRYCSPWWDTDGDGIPNRYDPWPFTYDLWYDYNLNFIPDWYDPYYCSYYPYWNYWNMGFWVDYGWYSPAYFRHPYNTFLYYDNYRTYSRLYDTRYVGSSRVNYHLDVKSEANWRKANSSSLRATGVASESRSRGYYSSRPADGRMLVPVSSTEGGTDVKSAGGSIAYDDNSGGTFTRNRAAVSSASGETGSSTRDRASTSGSVSASKRKATSTSSSAEERLRSQDRSRTPLTERADRDLSRQRSSGDDRAYIPSNSSRDRNISSSGSNTAPSSSGQYSGRSTSRDRTSGRLTSPTQSDRTRTQTYTRDRQSSSPAPSGAYSGSSRSRQTSGSTPSSATRPSSSRSSPAPAASAPSRSRSSSPPPSARSSGSGSSRSSGSSGGSKSSSGSSGRQRK